MRRRDFLALAGATAAAWPFAALAQQAPARRPGGGKPWLIAFFSVRTKEQDDVESLAPFRKGMADLGYVEGRDYTIEVRYAAGDATRYEAAARDLVALGPDVIVASGGVVAVGEATGTIPIVATMQDDELEMMVGSLARPIANVTGTYSSGRALTAKHCDLAFELVPTTQRIGVLVWTLGSDQGDITRQAVLAAAAARRFTPVMVDVAQPRDIAPGFRSLADAGVDVAVVGTGNVFSSDRLLTVAGAAALKLPTIYNQAGYVEAGGLISYGSSRPATSQRLATFVDAVFKGTRVADIPVQESSAYTMAINLKTAKSLGVTIPPAVMFRADEVIQ